MVKSRSLPLLTAITAMMLVASYGRADAALIAYICDDALCTGGNDTIVTDQGPGDNFPGSAQVGQINAGAVNFNGFTIITNVTQSKPLIGSAAAPQLDLTFNAVTNDDLSHTIFLYASDTGFTGTGASSLTLGGTQSPASAGTTVRGRAWGGTSNNNLDISPTNLFGDTGTTNATPFALTSTGSLLAGVNPFSLTIGVTITRAVAGTTTGDLNLSITPSGGGSGAGQTVPEPASVFLMGLGLAGAARYTRRKKTV